MTTSSPPTVVQALAAVMADVGKIGKDNRNAQQGMRYKRLPFWQRVGVTSSVEDCWLWLGAKTVGYGALRIEGRFIYAHRHAYELIVGPIPDSLTIDHLCRNRACCNPTHMEPVTLAENGRRAERTRLVRKGGRKALVMS